MEKWEGIVQFAGATALGKAVPRRARASISGVRAIRSPPLCAKFFAQAQSRTIVTMLGGRAESGPRPDEGVPGLILEAPPIRCWRRPGGTRGRIRSTGSWQ